MSRKCRPPVFFAFPFVSRNPALVRLAALLIVIAACHQSARGVDYTWNGSSDQEFTKSSNWTPGGVPNDNTDNAIFVNVPSAAYTVEWGRFVNLTNKSFEVRAGDVTLTCTEPAATRVFTLDSSPFPSVVIGAVAGPLTQLTVQKQFRSHRFESNGPLRIGDPVGSNGKLTIGLSWDSTSVALVGWHGTGELEFVSGGTLATSGGTLGTFAGSLGTVTVGSGRWTNTGDLTIGFGGVAILNISGSGRVSNDGTGYIGRVSTATGSVDVAGNGLWENNSSLYVGGDAGGVGGWGFLTIKPGGTVDVLNRLTIYTGSVVSLQGGTLNTGRLSGAADALDWTSGGLNIRNGDLTFDVGEPLGNSMQLAVDQPLTVSGVLNVGVNVGATLTVTGGGTVTSGSGLIGSVNAGSVLSTARITGSGSTWTMTGDLEMLSVNGADLIVEDGGVVSNHDALIARLPGSTADIDLTGADTQWNSSGSVYLGGDTGFADGTGDLRISNGAEMHVAGNLEIWYNYYGDISGGSVLTASNLDVYSGLTNDGATVEILGGTVNVIGADAIIESVIDVQGSAVNIVGGGQFYGTILGDGNTQVTLQDGDSTWETEPTLNLGTTTAGENRLGLLTVGSGAVVNVDGVTLLTPGALALNGGTINAAEFDLGGVDFQGWGALNGQVYGGDAVITATGNLTMGDPMAPLGFYHAGSLQVGTNEVRLNSAGFARSGAVTTIEPEGMLVAPNGLLLDNGDHLIGAGTVLAPIAAGFGSRIFVGEGDELELGDATALDGFFSDGVLVIGRRSVILHDANEAVLGSLTTLGFGDFSGSLAAENGAVLEFGKNLTGHGIVITPNDPTTPFINNGAIIGDAVVRPVELSGYVKGVGTMDNVTITGTDAPGFSTARVYRGNVTYAGALVIEIGGLSPGSGHDQINHSGAAALGGELRIERIDGFTPTVGDEFVILTFASSTGRFSSISGRGECLGPVFQIEYDTNDVTLVVVEAMAGDVDVDGDVDLVDYNSFQACLQGPTAGTAAGCTCSDVDQSGSVDLRDFAITQGAFTGPIP